MLPTETFFTTSLTQKRFALSFAAVLFLCLTGTKGSAQGCPDNIDFETGTFAGWTCYAGTVAAIGGQNVMTLNPSGGPVTDRHVMYSTNPGNGTDPYGGFPVNCPNGSGHSIRLGQPVGGARATGISYEFTIPANQNEYNLTYNYAVVFQDPNHLEFQQPRLEIEILNITDNLLIDCSSFSFHPFGTVLPGFQLSATPGGNTPVYYKDWSPVSVNLSGLAGKTIKLFFKTAGCTFSAHFGYAYIDVSSECAETLAGATFCQGDSVVNVTAPYGFQSYTWYDSTLTQVLGTQQTLTFSPPPASGTKVAVKVNPYAGYGCPQTLYVRLIDTLRVVANAGSNTVSCNNTPAQIGSLPRAGLVYQWQPVTGLSNPNISNPLASPTANTTYILTESSEGGGCVDTDTVEVRVGELNNQLELIGEAVLCSGNGNFAILSVQPADSIQWYKDNVAIPGAHQTDYTASVTGVYYAVLYSNSGCISTTRTQAIYNASASPPVASFVPASAITQCLVGNQYAFTNTSANTNAAVRYRWLMGDGTEITTKDASYIYKSSGSYKVMLISSDGACADSSEADIQVFQNATPDFKADPVCTNVPLQISNSTADTVGSPITYNWSFGNGQTYNQRNPPPQTFTTAGVYTISLSVRTAQCPAPQVTKRYSLTVSKPKPATRYPVKYAVINYPLTLQAREFGSSYLWSPGTSLSNAAIAAPIFKGELDQQYTIKITEPSGCVTVDTQLVKAVKTVEIYVPSAFTPNGDGKNDYLRFTTMGIKEIRSFRIFDRWGHLLYETRTEQPGWNGALRGVPLASMTVVWWVDGTGLDGKTYSRQGTTILIR